MHSWRDLTLRRGLERDKTTLSRVMRKSDARQGLRLAAGVRRRGGAGLVRKTNQLDNRSGFHLFHHTCAMNLDRFFRSTQCACNLLVQTAFHHEHHHLAFAWREMI